MGTGTINRFVFCGTAIGNLFPWCVWGRRLGFSIGCCMCPAHEIVCNFPWKARSVVEVSEESVVIAKGPLCISFDYFPAVKVSSMGFLFGETRNSGFQIHVNGICGTICLFL